MPMRGLLRQGRSISIRRTLMSNKSVLPVWGPYSKKYMGISRVMGDLKNKSGLTSADAVRFDFTVHPTVWNSSTPVPNVTVPSSYHLWKCSEDYTFYSYRYEQKCQDLVHTRCNIHHDRLPLFSGIVSFVVIRFSLYEPQVFHIPLVL